MLTEAVRRRPYQVLLFDEVEKAHPDVFNVLLQVLDDGRLTDGQGRVVDFKNTLIVLTSNLGSQALSTLPDGANAEARARPGDGGGAGAFPAGVPEPAGRDRAVRPAEPGGHGRDRRHPARHPRRSGWRARDITLEVDEAARTWLADRGYDPVYGARPLKRVIQKALQDQLAEKLLAGEILDGAAVPVTAGPDGLVIGARARRSRRRWCTEPPAAPGGHEGRRDNWPSCTDEEGLPGCRGRCCRFFFNYRGLSVSEANFGLGGSRRCRIVAVSGRFFVPEIAPRTTSCARFCCKSGKTSCSRKNLLRNSAPTRIQAVHR